MSTRITAERRTLATIDVPLQGGRALRVRLLLGPEGEAEELTLAAGFGDPWREDQRLILTPDALPGLLKALHELKGS